MRGRSKSNSLGCETYLTAPPTHTVWLSSLYGRGVKPNWFWPWVDAKLGRLPWLLKAMCPSRMKFAEKRGKSGENTRRTLAWVLAYRIQRAVDGELFVIHADAVPFAHVSCVSPMFGVSIPFCVAVREHARLQHWVFGGLEARGHL
jgi:hypothetical protein